MQKRDELLEVFLVTFGINFKVLSKSLPLALCIANDPDTPPEILEHLARSDNEQLLERIAEHPNVNPYILELLSAHQSPEVRAAVAGNCNVPAEVLDELCNDTHPDVRYNIAENPCISQEVLNKLTADSNPYVAHRAQTTLMRMDRASGTLKNFIQKMNARWVARRAM